MLDIRKSPRMMGHVRLEMEAALAQAVGAPTVKWLHGEGLNAFYRVTIEPSGDRVEGTLTHLFFHFNLTLPALWQHALRLEAEEALDALKGGSYDFVTCATCGKRWQVIDFRCSAHLLVCSNPQMPHRAVDHAELSEAGG